MLSRLSKIGRLLYHNPLLLLRILWGQFRMIFFPLPSANLCKDIHGVKIELSVHEDMHCKRMYFGLYESLVVDAMKKILSPGDTFLDVGANIGYLSATAASIVGKTGQVHSFEPSPRDFEKLKCMALMNPQFNIICNQFALGETEGSAEMYVSKGWLGWNTLVGVAVRDKNQMETVDVAIKRRDDYILERKNTIGRIALIKIDVEGVEFSVLKGLQKFFENPENRPPIICEVSPAFFRRLGIPLENLITYMKAYGYRIYSLLDLKTEVNISNLEVSTDFLFRYHA